MKISNKMLLAVIASIGMLMPIACGQKLPATQPVGTITIGGLPTGDPEVLDIKFVKLDLLPDHREQLTIEYSTIESTNTRREATIVFFIDNAIDLMEELPICFCEDDGYYARFQYSDSQIGWFEAILGVLATSGTARIERLSLQDNWLELEFAMMVTSVSVTSGWDDDFSVYADGTYTGPIR